MTPEEASAIVNACDGWIGWESWDADNQDVALDGHFTIQQLEAILTLMKLDKDTDG